jgi:hypothetical protein
MPYVFVQLLAAAVAAGVFKFMRKEFDLCEKVAANKEKAAAEAAKTAEKAHSNAEAADTALTAAPKDPEKLKAKTDADAQKAETAKAQGAAEQEAQEAKEAVVAEEKLLAVKCAAEFIGTFFLVLTVGLNVLKGAAAS